MSKRTNLDIKDASCLHIVHNLQHPTPRPTTNSTQTTMINAPKKYFLRHLAGRYGKSTKRSTQWRHHANEGKSGSEAKRVRALGALRSWDQNRSLRWRNDKKRTSSAIKTKRNGLRIMLREKPLGQESELKTQRQRFDKSRMIWHMLKSRDGLAESPKRCLRRCWFPLEIV